MGLDRSFWSVFLGVAITQARERAVTDAMRISRTR